MRRRYFFAFGRRLALYQQKEMEAIIIYKAFGLCQLIVGVGIGCWGTDVLVDFYLRITRADKFIKTVT